MKKRRTESSGSHPVRLKNLFRKVLPEDYLSHNAAIQQFQQFFDNWTEDAVFALVEVRNVSDQQLTLALPSPALVNYLRLHSTQIETRIAEQFGCRLKLKIVAAPGSDKARVEQSRLKPARRCRHAVGDQVSRAAGAIDDDELRRALKSLARTITRDE